MSKNTVYQSSHIQNLIYIGREIEPPFDIPLESIADPDTHLVVNYDQNKNRNPNQPDCPTKAPNLAGMSGGAIMISYVDDSDVSKYMEFVGLMIAKYPEKNCLLGLKKEAIVEYIISLLNSSA